MRAQNPRTTMALHGGAAAPGRCCVSSGLQRGPGGPGQIHDASDDVIVIRLGGSKLFIDLNGKDGPTLESSYKLGTFFTVRFVASGGSIKVYYNGATTPAIDHVNSAKGCYFKAGCYTQSNTSKGDDTSAYGQVVIRKLWISHS